MPPLAPNTIVTRGGNSVNSDAVSTSSCLIAQFEDLARLVLQELPVVDGADLHPVEAPEEDHLHVLLALRQRRHVYVVVPLAKEAQVLVLVDRGTCNTAPYSRPVDRGTWGPLSVLHSYASWGPAH